MWTVPLTEFQEEYLRNCSHRWNVKTGATRSGKTYLDCAVTIPKRICAARGEGLLVLMGNTLGTLERNVLSLMRVENSAKIRINDRIRLTCILMGGGRFWLLPEAATLRDALATALYSGKHPGVDERLDDGSTDIDTLDAYEYTIERDFKRLTNT